MVRRYVYTYKRKKIGEKALEEKRDEELINIDDMDDEELGKLIKSGIIRWQDIKEWHEKKEKTEK